MCKRGRASPRMSRTLAHAYLRSSAFRNNTSEKPGGRCGSHAQLQLLRRRSTSALRTWLRPCGRSGRGPEAERVGCLARVRRADDEKDACDGRSKRRSEVRSSRRRRRNSKKIITKTAGRDVQKEDAARAAEAHGECCSTRLSTRRSRDRRASRGSE